MEKEKILVTLFAVVAFLLPVGMYCLILASINRRPRPVLASGAWDTLGLLFAGTGFLLVVVPILITEFYGRTLGAVDGEKVVALWMGHWAVWLAYFIFLGSAGWLMLLLRARKTVIYNVDLELFSQALDQTLATIGLEGQRSSTRLVVGPAGQAVNDRGTAFREASARRADDHRHAEMEIETFPSMCHITLHWGECTAGLRREIESELHKSLEGAAPMENAAAGWFLTVSGLILGAVTSLIAAMAMLLFLR